MFSLSGTLPFLIQIMVLISDFFPILILMPVLLLIIKGTSQNAKCHASPQLGIFHLDIQWHLVYVCAKLWCCDNISDIKNLEGNMIYVLAYNFHLLVGSIVTRVW